MRKGALKKKQRQLEELHLDRREALGELVLGMFVQGSWDDSLMARGAAEVSEVEAELKAIAAGEPEQDSAEHDFSTSEHELATGEYTAEHGLPTGEYTAEHDLPGTGEYTAEHDLPTGEHTGEHDLPETGEHTAEH
ncbi:MAG: hypothetical protein ACSLFD_01695, partial [Solirubrobacterales bacterium]